MQSHACDDALVASGADSETWVVIGDFGCVFSEKTIFKLNSKRLAADGTREPFDTVSFDSECTRLEKGGFSCRKNGVSVLAGTTYKPVATKEWACKEDNYRPPKFLCVNGCKKPGTPMEFKIIPYQCGG